MLALLGCSAIAVPFAGLFFSLGVRWARARDEEAAVLVFPPRHASHHHRRSAHLRLVHADRNLELASSNPSSPFDQDNP